MKNVSAIFVQILIGFLKKSEWTNLNAVGMLVCERTEKKSGKKSVERRYFLTSVTDVEKANFAMRAHWGIENNLHWVLDTIFNEDYCLVRKDNAATNMSVINSQLCNKREGCQIRILYSL